MIRFYLAEEPVLNNVPTWLLHRDEDLRLRARAPRRARRQGSARRRRLRHADRPGGDRAPSARRSARGSSRAPDKYIAQPTLALSTCPTFVEAGLAPRHIDLRPVRAVGQDSQPGARRPDARRAARRLAGRQLVAGRRHQGHLGPRDSEATLRRCSAAPPTSSTGWRATSSAPRTPRACSTSRYRMSLLPYEVIEPGLAWAEPWAVPLITSGLATDVLRALSGSSRPRTCCAS